MLPGEGGPGLIEARLQGRTSERVIMDLTNLNFPSLTPPDHFQSSPTLPKPPPPPPKPSDVSCPLSSPAFPGPCSTPPSSCLIHADHWSMTLTSTLPTHTSPVTNHQSKPCGAQFQSCKPPSLECCVAIWHSTGAPQAHHDRQLRFQGRAGQGPGNFICRLPIPRCPYGCRGQETSGFLVLCERLEADAILLWFEASKVQPSPPLWVLRWLSPLRIPMAFNQ